MVPPPNALCVYLSISKLHSNLAVANLLAHNNLLLCNHVQVNLLATAKIECTFEIGKLTLLRVPFILLLMVHYLISVHQLLIPDHTLLPVSILDPNTPFAVIVMT